MTKTEKIVKEITERKSEFGQMSDNSEKIVSGVIATLERVSVDVVYNRAVCECYALRVTYDKLEKEFTELYREYYSKASKYGDTRHMDYVNYCELKRIHVEAEQKELHYYEVRGDYEVLVEIREILKKYVN